MIKTITKNKTEFVLKAIFTKKGINKDVIQNKNIITEFISKKEAVIFLGDKNKFSKEDLVTLAKIIAKAKRGYQIDVPSLITQNVNEKFIVTSLVEEYILTNGDVFTLKTVKKEKPGDVNLLGLSKEGKETFKIATKESEMRNWVRSLQVQPLSELNSENYAVILKKELSKYKNLSVKVLDKKQIEALKMGLIIGVNKGSAHEAKVVIAEYKGNPSSKEKTVIVGKGIMYDSGGYALKPGRHMTGMKFDMSGTAIVAGAIRLIADNKPKANYSVVLPLTDNLIGKHAQKNDDVCISMNGKTVEINNTDAEGRLVLADGLTYAIRKLKATRLIDVATLTGAVITALGSTYTGAWTTVEKDWKEVEAAAAAKNELVWRMPFHADFERFIKKSPIADLRNTDMTGKGGSSSAASFLKEFTEGVPYIHFDIAGTADVNNNATGVLVKTLAELANA